MGKSGSYMDGGHPGARGRDLHIGEWNKRVLPPTAPLPIASATLTGVALAAARLILDDFISLRWVKGVVVQVNSGKR